MSTLNGVIKSSSHSSFCSGAQLEARAHEHLSDVLKREEAVRLLEVYHVVHLKEETFVDHSQVGFWYKSGAETSPSSPNWSAQIDRDRARMQIDRDRARAGP